MPAGSRPTRPTKVLFDNKELSLAELDLFVSEYVSIKDRVRKNTPEVDLLDMYMEAKEEAFANIIRGDV